MEEQSENNFQKCKSSELQLVYGRTCRWKEI